MKSVEPNTQIHIGKHMYRLADSQRVGRSLFATCTIPLGTHILSDSACLLRFQPEKLEPLEDYLNWNASSKNNNRNGDAAAEEAEEGWFPILPAANFIKRYKLLPALALAAHCVINTTYNLSLVDGSFDSSSTKDRAYSLWKALCEMHCPSLPISQDTLLLMEACKELLRRSGTVDLIAQAWRSASSSSSLASATAAPCAASATATAGDSQQEDDDSTIIQNENCAASALAHAVMAMKTNCHRSTDGLWCMFPLASKLAHSCDPNCYFVGPSPENGYTASFVAMREIAAGEVLSFSYFGGPSLHLNTFQRRARLLRSHLFVCRCERCEEAEDFSAAVVTKCSRASCQSNNKPTQSISASASASASAFASVDDGDDVGVAMFVRLSCPQGLPDADAPMGASWRCTVCQNRIRDSDLPAPLRSLRIEPCGALEGESSAIGAFFDASVKLKYSAIIAAVRRATANPATRRVVGDSLLSEACRQATVYFSTMCQLSLKMPSSSATGGEGVAKKVTPFQLLFCWAMRYFRSLDAAGIIKHCKIDSPPHMLVVATAVQLIDVSLSGGDSALDVRLAEAATPGTGILAVLARHVRGVVESTSRVQHAAAVAVTCGSIGATTAAATAAAAAACEKERKKAAEAALLAAKRKVEKVKTLCELEWEADEVKKDSLYEVLCMASDDAWREMSTGRKWQVAQSKQQAREVELLESRGGLDAGFEKLIQAWAV